MSTNSREPNHALQSSSWLSVITILLTLVISAKSRERKEAEQAKLLPNLDNTYKSHKYNLGGRQNIDFTTHEVCLNGVLYYVNFYDRSRSFSAKWLSDGTLALCDK